MLFVTPKKGFTLLSLLVYAGLVVIVGLFITEFALQIIKIHSEITALGEISDSAQRAEEIITQEIHHAVSVYTPTSRFNGHPGQLSLETTRYTPSDEDRTFVDFYLDDNHLYMKREGEAAKLITSEQTSVSNFVLTYLNTSTPYPAIRLSLTVAYHSYQTTLVSTVSLRSYE